MACDGLVRVANFCRRHLDWRTRDMHHHVELRCAQRLAVREWHLVVNLSDDDARFLNGCFYVVADESAAVIAIFIRGTHLNESNIATDDTRFDHRSDLPH